MIFPQSFLRIIFILLIFNFLISNTQIRYVKSVTSLLNTTDIETFNNEVLISTNGGLYKYNQAHNYIENIIDNLNFKDVSCIASDQNGRIWLGGNYGNGVIQILDSDLDLVNTIDYVKFNRIDKISISESYAFAIVEYDNSYMLAQYSNELNGLSSYLNIYQDFSEDFLEINDIGIINDNIYVATDNGVFYADFNNDLLMLSNSWMHIYENQNIDKLFFFNNELYFVSNGGIYNENSLLLNLDITESIIEYNVSENNIYISTERKLFQISNDMESFNLVYELPSDMNTIIQSFHVLNDILYVGLNNQGFIIIQNNYVYHFIPQTIFNNNCKSLLINDNRDLSCISKDGLFIYKNIHSIDNPINISNLYSINNYIENYYPVYSSDKYNGNILPYISGAMDPLSFVSDGDFYYFPNSGLYPTYENYNGYESNILASLIEIDSDIEEISEHWGDDIFTGLNGIYNPQWTTGYTVINQLKFDNYNNLWIINPYSEGDINKPFVIKLKNDDWIYVEDNQNINAYLPTEISFDQYNNLWIAYQSENELYADSDVSYSPGGLRVLDYNDITTIDDDIWYNYPFSDLLGVNVWSIDIGRDKYNNDILWIVSDLGVMGYLIDISLNQTDIMQIELIPINPYYYFTDIPFEQGCKIRVDNQNNAWVTTKNDGLKIIQSNGLLWPDNYGISSENSELLSNTINDIVFDNYGFVYIATDKGISVFETVFSNEENREKITFSPNPFLIDGNNTMTISNFPSGSTIQIMNLSGKILKEFITNNQTSIFNWNGMDSNNNLLSTGVYLVSSFHQNKKNRIGKFVIIRK